MMDSNQSAARDARRYLAERVRNDWSFPSIVDDNDSDDLDAANYDTASTAASTTTAAGGGPSERELHGVTEFRERYYGSTDDDNEDDDSDYDDDNNNDNNDLTNGGEGGGNNNGEGGKDASYKFDSPEHVGRRLEERAQRRKRRRRAALEEEMGWNRGMRCFVRRRDAWTGAASVRRYARRRSRASGEMEAEEVEARRAVERVLEETAVVEEVVVVKGEGEGEGDNEKEKEEQGDSVGEADGEEGSATADDDAAAAGKQTETETETEKRVNINIPASEEPLVPLAPPLLAHNAIRQSITPKAYPDIYGKIVVAGQTPKVPINLAHMTRALVQGWKDDGEWPPRPGPADPLMGRKKVAAAGGTRVGTLAAVLGGGDGSAAKGSATSGGGHHGEFLAHHPHLQKGVESVKKVFRLSGGGHHHGHSNPGGGLVHDGQPPTH